MRPNRPPADLEAQRWWAVAVLESGLELREESRKIGCVAAYVSRWQTEIQTRALDALGATRLRAGHCA